MTMKMVVITIPPVRTGQSETTTVPTRTPLNWVKPFWEERRFFFLQIITSFNLTSTTL